MTDYREKYPALYQFFAGYFNQDWEECFLWKDQEPNYRAVVRRYKLDDPPEDARRAVGELRGVIALDDGFGEGQWRQIVNRELGASVYPPGLGLGYREWLEDVLRILEEPMGTTKKEFVPAWK